MTRSPGYCGVILAAGTPERLSKSLSPWPEGNPLGSTLLSSHIDVLNTLSEFVLVVAGSNEASITPTVYAHGGYLIRTGDSGGDLLSLQIGVREVLSRGRDTAIVTTVELVPFTAANLRTLCTAYQESGRDTWAVAPTTNEGSAYPLIAGRELIEQILRAPAQSSLADVISANASHILSINLGKNCSECSNTEQVAGK